MWCVNFVSNSKVGHRVFGPRAVFRTGTECEWVKVVGTCFSHAHKTTASLHAVLRSRLGLEHVSRWSADDMGNQARKL